jgi:hypothetical protein
VESFTKSTNVDGVFVEVEVHERREGTIENCADPNGSPVVDEYSKGVTVTEDFGSALKEYANVTRLKAPDVYKDSVLKIYEEDADSDKVLQHKVEIVFALAIACEMFELEPSMVRNAQYTVYSCSADNPVRTTTADVAPIVNDVEYCEIRIAAVETGADVPETKGRQLVVPDKLDALEKITVANKLVEEIALIDEFALI